MTKLLKKKEIKMDKIKFCIDEINKEIPFGAFA